MQGQVGLAREGEMGAKSAVEGDSCGICWAVDSDRGVSSCSAEVPCGLQASECGNKDFIIFVSIEGGVEGGRLRASCYTDEKTRTSIDFVWC